MSEKLLTSKDRSLALAARLRTIAGVADTPNAHTLRESADMLDLTSPSDETRTEPASSGRPEMKYEEFGYSLAELGALCRIKDRHIARLEAAEVARVTGETEGKPCVCADSEDGNHVLKQDGPFSVVYCDACGMNRGFRDDPPPTTAQAKPDAWMSSINPDLVTSNENEILCWNNPPIPLYRRTEKATTESAPEDPFSGVTVELNP